MPITVAERDALAAILKKIDSAELVAISRLYFDTYVMTEMAWDARRVLANFAAAGTGWNDVPSSTSPAWKAIQVAFIRSVEELFLPYLPKVLKVVDAPPAPPPSAFAVIDGTLVEETLVEETLVEGTPPSHEAPVAIVVEPVVNDVVAQSVDEDVVEPVGDTEESEAA